MYEQTPESHRSIVDKVVRAIRDMSNLYLVDKGKTVEFADTDEMGEDGEIEIQFYETPEEVELYWDDRGALATNVLRMVEVLYYTNLMRTHAARASTPSGDKPEAMLFSESDIRRCRDECRDVTVDNVGTLIRHVYEIRESVKPVPRRRRRAR